MLESEKIMKKKVLIVMTALLILVGCSKKTVVLADHIESLSVSMKAFYELDSKKYEGTAFDAKVIDLIEVPHTFSNETDINFYRYRIVIAPKYDTAIKLQSVRLEPKDTAIYNYLNSSSPSGAGNIEIWNSVTASFSFEKWEELEEFGAYELAITFNNLTNQFMDEEGIEEAVLNDALQNLNLIIRYNDTSDTISLENIERIAITPDLLNSREDLYELSSEGRTFDQFTPYE